MRTRATRSQTVENVVDVSQDRAGHLVCLNDPEIRIRFVACRCFVAFAPAAAFDAGRCPANDREKQTPGRRCQHAHQVDPRTGQRPRHCPMEAAHANGGL